MATDSLTSVMLRQLYMALHVQSRKVAEDTAQLRELLASPLSTPRSG